MTADEFAAVTGRPPADDDLERVNCPQAGSLGHVSCGWCARHTQPMFQCPPTCWRWSLMSRIEESLVHDRR